MHISKVSVKNFRLLENVEMAFETDTTVIVGRNNSGKTSLTELFRRLLTDRSPSFLLEDFSLCKHENFWTAYEEWKQNEDVTTTRNLLPFISVSIEIDYSENLDNYGPLSDFVVDLDAGCNKALIHITYEAQKGKIASFFEGIDLESIAPIEQKKAIFLKIIKEKIQQHYAPLLTAQDPNDETNKKEVEWSKLNNLLATGFISAQRGLDDAFSKEGAEQKKNNVLGAILEKLFTNAVNSNDPDDGAIIANLRRALEEVQLGIDTGFNLQLAGLLPTFNLFGYPGLSDPRLGTETILDIERVLKNHTRVHYAGINGINLPEAYNGLGTRNLIYILLQLLEFYKDFTAHENKLGVQLVFIEEPEAHLHPQMQEVFIAKLHQIAEAFSRQFPNRGDWSVQFVVTTHSPHMANKAPFDALRYFLTEAHTVAEHIRTTQIKDLKTGFAGTLATDREFLHKYMTLTGCNLLFADKVILIEGATERILLPEIFKKIDAAHTNSPKKLTSQYIAALEVGGAHAHNFFGLLRFLNLRTLIITDIDSVKPDAENDLIKCVVTEGTRTSNSCLKSWYHTTVSPAQLLSVPEETKIDGVMRVAYQIPHGDGHACGRSYEDAFILANHALFQLQNTAEAAAWTKAKKFKKTDFAIEYGIDNTAWTVPRYIAEGLIWLGEVTTPAANTATAPVGEAA